MMRILMLDNEFPPKGGGMGTANKALMEQFALVPDIEIDLITSALDNRYSEEKFAARMRIFFVPVGVGNIHHASNPELTRYALQAYREAARLHREAPYDFSFAWSAVPAGAVSLALEMRFGLPFMTWISGPDTPGFERRYDYLFPVLKPLLKRIWHRSRPLIAKCREEVDLIHAVAPDVKVEIIPNGVDLERFRPGEVNSSSDPLVVICAARLIERKGQRQLLDAAAQLKLGGTDIELRFLGDGDALASYRAYAQEAGVDDRVTFLGFVPPEQIPDQLRQADVFALPSYFEGVSLATLEAMGCGLPVIVTRTGGIEEMVRDGEDGYLIDWNDVDSLVERLQIFASDRELARRMGRAAYGQVQRYRWENIAGDYFRLFRVRAGQAGYMEAGS